MAKKTEHNALTELTQVFRKLGADAPEQWARSEIKEGIPQLATFVFLRQAWTNVVDEVDDSWIDRLVGDADETATGPCSAMGPALKRMLARGVARSDIVDLIRGMQYELLFALCYQLSAPGVVEFLDETMPSVQWKLFQLNERGEPSVAIECLHESVLSLDPTGREMRPR